MGNKCSCAHGASSHQHRSRACEPDPAHDPGCHRNYGGKDSEAEARVFREVRVDAFYARYEPETEAYYARIGTLINAVEVRSPCGEAVLRRAVFCAFFNWRRLISAP
jgi:hypothetical protein